MSGLHSSSNTTESFASWYICESISEIFLVKFNLFYFCFSELVEKSPNQISQPFFWSIPNPSTPPLLTTSLILISQNLFLFLLRFFATQKKNHSKIKIILSYLHKDFFATQKKITKKLNATTLLLYKCDINPSAKLTHQIFLMIVPKNF